MLMCEWRRELFLYCPVFTDCSASLIEMCPTQFQLTLARPQWVEGKFWAAAAVLFSLFPQGLFLHSHHFFLLFFFFFFLNSHPYCQTSSSIVLWWRVKTKTATIFFSNWFSSFKPFAAEGKQEMIGGQAYTVGICGSFSNLYFILSVKQCTRRALSTLLTPTRAAAHQMW